MRSIQELYKLVDKRLDGRDAKDFTLERLVPDETELEGFTDIQLISVLTDRGLRIPYCCWCEDMIKPNGKWIEMPSAYQAMLLTNKFLMRNQGICPTCMYDEGQEFMETLSDDE